MRIIKCDICGKEYTPEENLHREYTYNGRSLDVCTSCLPKYNDFKNRLIEEYKNLEIEYENKRKEVYKNIIQKYGMNDS